MNRSWMQAIAGALGLAAAVSAAAAPPPPPVATPLGAWTVDYGDQRCLAARRFGYGKNSLVFAIEDYPSDRAAHFIIRPEQNVGRYTPGSHAATVSVDGRKVDSRLVVWPTKQNAVLIFTGYWFGSDAPPLPFATAQRMTISSGMLNVALPLNAIAKVMPLLADCTAGLLASWGFSRADQARMAQEPQGDVGRFFSANDYPADAVRAGTQGQVSVRFTVGADGKASGCVVRFPSGDPALDKATCAIINQRVRYTPAKDATGTPMTIVYMQTVRWVFPGF